MAKKREVIGYFLQSNREFIRDEHGRMNQMYDKYIKGKAIAKKINTFDGISIVGVKGNAFFIDFTESKPKAKKLTAHKTMQGILKKAADSGVISKGMASSFKLGKITAPVVKGKLELSGLEYEKIKVKPAKKSKRKPLTSSQLIKEVYKRLSKKGYLKNEFKKERYRVGYKQKKVKGKTKREAVYNTAYRSLLSGGKYWMVISPSPVPYYIYFMPINSSIPKVQDTFVSSFRFFDDTDEKVLIQMLKRMKIKPSLVSTRKYKSKGTKTKVTTIAFKGKKFSITGTLTGFSRAAFVKMAEKLGGKFQNHISKDLDMLIVGSKPGKTKVAQAKKYGIEIVKFNDIMLMHDSK